MLDEGTLHQEGHMASGNGHTTSSPIPDASSSPSSSPGPSLTPSQQNQRRKQPKRQIVFVDPDDASSPWWWPAMVVPRHEYHIFKESVNGEVRDPKDGECVVVYFEDASFNTLKESELKTFCPHTPPYTNYVSGPNGKAFRSDTAVVLATLFWERGKIPPAFTWLREIEERNKQSRLAGGPEDQSSLEKGEDSTANSSFTSTHSHKKSGSISVAGTPRRASQVSLVGQHPPSPATNGARKDSNSSKDPLRKVDKTIRKTNAGVPIGTNAKTKTVAAFVASGNGHSAGTSTRPTAPIVNLPTSATPVRGGRPSHPKVPSASTTSQPSISRSREDMGSSPDGMEGPPPKRRSSAVGVEATAVSASGRPLHVRRNRESNPNDSTITKAPCARCGKRDFEGNRDFGVDQMLVANVNRNDGTAAVVLCRSCRDVYDEAIPPLVDGLDDVEPVWAAERKPLRLLKSLLPEGRTDCLSRHFRALQAIAPREHPQHHSTIVHPVQLTSTIGNPTLSTSNHPLTAAIPAVSATIPLSSTQSFSNHQTLSSLSAAPLSSLPPASDVNTKSGSAPRLVPTSHPTLASSCISESLATSTTPTASDPEYRTVTLPHTPSPPTTTIPVLPGASSTTTIPAQ